MSTPRRIFWDEALSTGEMEMDAQHRYLIDIFNDLGTAIEEGYSREDIQKVLKILKFYAGWHFNKEEECMTRFRCPAGAQNKAAHAAFILKLDQYEAEFERTPDASTDLALKIHAELLDWIEKHILVVDSQLYACIHPKPTGSP
jgi:hemerythrin